MNWKKLSVFTVIVCCLVWVFRGPIATAVAKGPGPHQHSEHEEREHGRHGHRNHGPGDHHPHAGAHDGDDHHDHARKHHGGPGHHRGSEAGPEWERQVNRMKLHRQELELERMEMQLMVERRELDLDSDAAAFEAIDFALESLEPDSAIEFLSEIAKGDDIAPMVKLRIHRQLAQFLVENQRAEEAKPHIRAVIESDH